MPGNTACGQYPRDIRDWRNQDQPQRTEKAQILVIPGGKVDSGLWGGIQGTAYILYDTSG